MCSKSWSHTIVIAQGRLRQSWTIVFCGVSANEDEVEKEDLEKEDTKKQEEPPRLREKR